MDAIKMIVVPYYDSLSIKQNWRHVSKLYPDILKFFPNYDPLYIPNRKFFWEIFATLHYSEAANIIKNERKKRYEEEAKEKSKEITIDKEILNQIQGSLYFSKKNGRALFKINPKDYDQPNRKRKLQEIENSESKIEESPFNIPKALIKRSKKDDDQDLESQRFVSLGKMTKLNKH